MSSESIPGTRAAWVERDRNNLAGAMRKQDQFQKLACYGAPFYQSIRSQLRIRELARVANRTVQFSVNKIVLLTEHLSMERLISEFRNWFHAEFPSAGTLHDALARTGIGLIMDGCAC